MLCKPVANASGRSATGRWVRKMPVMPGRPSAVHSGPSALAQRTGVGLRQDRSNDGIGPGIMGALIAVVEQTVVTFEGQ